MRENGDSSVWKSLAVAFGDGLAFGVGVKLAQNSQRQAAVPASPDSGAILNRLEQMEERLRRIEDSPAQLDPAVLNAVTAVLDARVTEHISQVERRLAEMEARIVMETAALGQQDRSLATRMEQDLATLKSQIIALNREFAEQVGQIVAEQVAAQVASRTAGLEHSLRAQAMDAADDAVQERLAPMRAEVAQKDDEIADLRKRVTATDAHVFDFILAMGEMCRQAAERLAPPPAPKPPAPALEASKTAAAASPATEDPGAELREHFDPSVDPPAPNFAEVRKPSGFWRMPMVSSFVAAIASLAMLRFF